MNAPANHSDGAHQGWMQSSTCRAMDEAGRTAGREYGLAESISRTLAWLFSRQARQRFGGADATGRATLDGPARAFATDRLGELGDRCPCRFSSQNGLRRTFRDVWPLVALRSVGPRAWGGRQEPLTYKCNRIPDSFPRINLGNNLPVRLGRTSIGTPELSSLRRSLAESPSSRGWFLRPSRETPSSIPSPMRRHRRAPGCPPRSGERTTAASNHPHRPTH